MATLLPRIKSMDLALYLHYTETDLEDGANSLGSDDYLGEEYFHVLSNQDTLEMTYAPRKALIDLRTMMVVAVDIPLVNSFKIEDMLDMCDEL